jgi:hypothetical protein
MKKLSFVFAALAMALAISPAAKADSFDFTYSDVPDGVSGSGTLYGTAQGGGVWLIDSATGSFNDGINSGAITLIQNAVAPGANSSPSGYFDYDNLLSPYASPDQALDYDGLLFSFAGVELDLWDGGFPPAENWSENNGNGGAGTFAITAIHLDQPAATPEPASLLLMGTGLMTLLVLSLRNRRRPVLVANL